MDKLSKEGVDLQKKWRYGIMEYRVRKIPPNIPLFHYWVIGFGPFLSVLQAPFRA